MARFVPNTAEIRSTPVRLVLPKVRRVCRRIEGDAKRRVQVDTGRLKTSIGTKITSNMVGVKGRVGSKARHALVNHEGAVAHAIRPRSKKALAFYWAKVGANVMFAKVNHPGMTGSRYLTIPLVIYGTEEGFRVRVAVGGLSGELP